MAAVETSNSARYGLWILNSLTMMVVAFFSLNILLDVVNYWAGTLMGFQLIFDFDAGFVSFKKMPVMNRENLKRITYLLWIEPVLLLIVSVFFFRLYKKFSKKKDLRKLLFLWTSFFSFSILGGSFWTSYMDKETGPMSMLFAYLRWSPDYLPLFGLVLSLVLILLGVGRVKRFLSMAPSIEIIKDPIFRVFYFTCVTVIPLLVFFVFIFIISPTARITCRQYSSLFLWVGVLACLVSLIVNETTYRRTPAFKNSSINKPLPLWYLSAIALVIISRLLSLN
jgi:hypothetical protein